MDPSLFDGYPVPPLCPPILPLRQAPRGETKLGGPKRRVVARVARVHAAGDRFFSPMTWFTAVNPAWRSQVHDDSVRMPSEQHDASGRKKVDDCQSHTQLRLFCLLWGASYLKRTCWSEVRLAMMQRET